MTTVLHVLHPLFYVSTAFYVLRAMFFLCNYAVLRSPMFFFVSVALAGGLEGRRPGLADGG